MERGSHESLRSDSGSSPVPSDATSGGQNKFSSVRVKIPCRGGVRRGEIMAPRPSGGAKIWCHHRPLSRKRTVWGGKSNQSLLLSLPPTHYPNSSQSQKTPPSPRRPRPPAPGSSRPQKKASGSSVSGDSTGMLSRAGRSKEERDFGGMEGEGGRKFGEQPSARGENLERRASAQPKIWCHTQKKRPRKFILHGTCNSPKCP